MEKINLAFINRLGKRLLAGRSVAIADQPPPPDEEIPRYPPFMKGLPAAPVDRILSTQTELINAIEHALSLPDDLYQTIAAPVIERYAAFSHLLPASESHHHRGGAACSGMDWKSPTGPPKRRKAVCLPPMRHRANARNKNYAGVWRCVLPDCCMTSANPFQIWRLWTGTVNIPGTLVMKT